MSILQKIIQTKTQEVAHFIKNTDRQALLAQAQAYTCQGFAAALRAKQAQGQIGIIAEIKKASPSQGIICENFNPVAVAQAYHKAGAACLSVLTDRTYFMGHDDYLMAVRKAVALPILRKDFIIDDSQIIHAKAMGADCILLIMACLDDDKLAKLHHCAIELTLDVLIEIHSQDELERALKLPNSSHNIYGINNRDLNTFNVDINNSIELGKQLFDALGTTALVVSESGIHHADDIHQLQQHDIHHFLIGEQFMKTGDAGAALHHLLDKVNQNN